MRKFVEIAEVTEKINSTINQWNKKHSLKRECGNRITISSVSYETEEMLQTCSGDYTITIAHYPNRVDEICAIKDEGEEVIEVSSLPFGIAKDLYKSFAIHMEKVGFYL